MNNSLLMHDMNSWKRLGWLFLLFFGGMTAGMFAQNGKVVFEEIIHEFGEIKEEIGRVQAEFHFKVEGEGPVRLTSVKSSCGCTIPSWPREEFSPGDSGIIRATFNPENRPGVFDKAIVVTTSGTPQTQILRIKGNVIPKPKGPEYHYPFKEGNLRFKTNHLAFGTVLHDQVDSAFTILYNESSKPIRINPKQTMIPPHVRVVAPSRTIKPHDTLRLQFQYNAALKNDWGFCFEYFMLATDDPLKPNKRINVSADIKEHFDEGTVSAEPQPRIIFDRKSHDFGTIYQSEPVHTTFLISNQGKGVLTLRKIHASCGCTVPETDKTTLGPGESTELRVSFNPGTREGKQQKEISIVANDPANPEIRLKLISDVHKKTAPQE